MTKRVAPKEPKRGRKPLLTANEQTLKIVTGLGNIQATTKECAAVLGVTEPTYLKFKSDNPEVAEAYSKGSGEGLASLRRRQFKAASDGNATMLVWLGKQYLGQADKQEVGGVGGAPIQAEVAHKLDKDSAELIANLVK